MNLTDRDGQPLVVTITPGTATGRASGDDATLIASATAPGLLIALAVAHLLMLTAATVLSVYKPWGKTWLGRRQSHQPSRRVVTA